MYIRKNNTALEKLEYITDQTRLIARTTAGAVRASILSAPDRLFAAPPDLKRWNTPKFHNDLEYLDIFSPVLNTNVIRDFLDGAGQKAVVPELHVIHRMEFELTLITHIINKLTAKYKPNKLNSAQPGYVTKYDTLELILDSMIQKLERFSVVFLPALQLWAESAITSPEPEANSNDMEESYWEMFDKCIPGFRVPGNAYPSLEMVMRRNRNNPYLLELIRTDDALYTILLMLILFYDGLPKMEPLWSGITADMLQKNCGITEGYAGWSGGDGICTAMTRLNMAERNMFLALESLFSDEHALADWSVFSKLA